MAQLFIWSLAFIGAELMQEVPRKQSNFTGYVMPDDDLPPMQHGGATPWKRKGLNWHRFQRLVGEGVVDQWLLPKWHEVVAFVATVMVAALTALALRLWW